MLFPIFCPASPKRENNMWNWKMVFTEGFKDVWNLEYILKVNFSSNYVIMVKLLENVKHKINMLPDRKWQKILSCVGMWEGRVCVHVLKLTGSSNTSEQPSQEPWYTLYMYKTSTDIKDTCTEHGLVLSALERDSLLLFRLMATTVTSVDPPWNWDQCARFCTVRE